MVQVMKGMSNFFVLVKHNLALLLNTGTGNDIGNLFAIKKLAMTRFSLCLTSSLFLL